MNNSIEKELTGIIKAGVLTNIDYEEQPAIIAKNILKKFDVKLKPKKADNRERDFNEAYRKGVEVY